MTFWALLIEYDGGPFHGWQRQNGALTVQSVLETAASRLTGAPVTAEVAGRTDAGVHAAGQVAGLALPDRLDARQVRDALNFHMRPHPVVVLRATPAPPGWHPRFSAIGRTYRYVILNRPVRPALLHGRVWQTGRPLDEAAMQQAAAHLRGHHDFTSFRATACQAKSPLRTLDRLDVRRDGETIEIVAEARSFLHHQVRNMVGTLKLVGEGRWQADQVRAALLARDRRAAGPTAPGEGLCLMEVRYAADPWTAGVTALLPRSYSAPMNDTSLARPRPARSDELDAVRQLVTDAYTGYIALMGQPPGPMLDDYARRIADGQAWVLDVDGAIAGLIVLEDDGDALLLDNVAVSPAAQGKGYGRTLIAFAEDEARRRGHVELRLYTNVLMTENIALYEGLGFHRTKTVREQGFERVYMAKAMG